MIMKMLKTCNCNFDEHFETKNVIRICMKCLKTKM